MISKMGDVVSRISQISLKYIMDILFVRSLYITSDENGIKSQFADIGKYSMLRSDGTIKKNTCYLAI